MKALVSPLFLALTLAASGALAAEDMYRSTMPDGSVRYGESPEPGARSVKKVQPPPPATGVTVVTPGERGRTFDAPPGGGVAVLPQQDRPPTQPAYQGQTFGPGTDRPKSAY